MRFNKITGSLFVAALGFGIANAAVIEEVKVSAEGAKQFTIAPKIIDMDGKKVFVSTAKGYKVYSLKEKIKIDPDKKYMVSVNVKRLNEKPSYIWIGFLPYTPKGRLIGLQHGGNNTKGSFTALAAAAAKGAKTITVKDASEWEKGPHHFVAFNAKEDMSDIPNFDIVGRIAKIEKTGDVYTISFNNALKKAYPAGTMIRQHRSGGTYIYTKDGMAPKEWAAWKGKPAQGKIFRKAAYVRPMIMIRCNDKETGAAFDDFIVEEL